jgi:hypothetical protein
VKNKNHSGRSLLILFIIGFFTFPFCSKSDNNKDLTELNYGTSFGECTGYCLRNINLKSDSTTYTRSGWIDTIKTITCTTITDKFYWHTLKRDFNSDSFMALPGIIGCPDCADGGAEWIEIVLTNGYRHRVTFKYQSEPDLTKNYIIRLRELLAQFENCNGK